MRRGKMNEFSPRVARTDACHAGYLPGAVAKSRKVKTFASMYAKKDARHTSTVHTAVKPEEAVKYNKDIANKIVTQVLKRLEVGSQKYGAEYFLADCIGDELYQELLDQVGWALINAVRWVEVFQKRFLPTDAIYWKKFMGNQKTEFLNKLKQEVEEELNKREKK